MIDFFKLNAVIYPRQAGYYIMVAVLAMSIGMAGYSAEKRIAVLLPKTGRYAVYGELQSQGYTLAESRVIRGRDIRVRYFDLNESYGQELAAFLTTTVLPWQPDILIGPYSSGRAAELVAWVKGRTVPLIIPTATLDALTTDKANSNVFRLAPPAGLLAEITMDYVHHQITAQAVDSIVILAEESAFSACLIDMLKVSALKNRLDVSNVVVYQPGYLDSKRHQIIVTDKTALLAISRSSGDCQAITEEFGDRSLLIGMSAGFSTRDYTIYLKKSKHKPLVVSPWDNDVTRATVADFQSDFSTTYKDAFTDALPQYHSAQAYSALMVAADALVKVTPDKMIHQVLADCNLETPIGQVQFVNYAGYYRQSVIPPVVQHFDGKAFVNVNQRMSSAAASETDTASRTSFLSVVLKNQLMVLFIVLALGLSLGRITIKGLSLGTAGVLFVALFVGHFHLTIPSGIGSFGLVLFIYCVGISAGPNFFKSFAEQGIQLAKLSVLTVSVGALITVALVKLFNVPLDLAIGLFAGSLTSTPALAAGIDALKDMGDLVPVGYGISYPFGVIGVVLFVQLVPRLLKKDLDQLDAESGDKVDANPIRRRVVRVVNPAIIGKTLGEVTFIDKGDYVVSRVIEDGNSSPVKFDLVLKQGMQLLLIGHRKKLDLATELIGETVKTNYVLDIEQQQMKVVVTSKNAIRKKMKDIQSLKRYGVVVSRIVRHSVEFVPNGETVVEEYDTLTAVGERKDLDAFAEFVGHKQRALEHTDIFKICLAIILGILLGSFPIVMPNGKIITLGLAGGPLFVALVLSYFRKGGYFPPASRSLIQKLGLMLFLASAGVKAGNRLVPTIQEHGLSLFIMGMALTLVPMIITFCTAYFIMKINLLETLGGVCGGMTSTPALGAITARTDSMRTVTSYAVAYPVALILMTVAVQVLASIFVS